jgi:hypothetical protein
MAAKFFTCVGCNKQIKENQRRFVNVDWCSPCMDADTNALKPQTGYIWAKPPRYVTNPRKGIYL